jgi:preprotein translocase SecE subunit
LSDLARLQSDLMSVGAFLSEVRDELRKVAWPTSDEVMRNSGVILGVLVAVIIFLVVADVVFGHAVTVLR